MAVPRHVACGLLALDIVDFKSSGGTTVTIGGNEVSTGARYPVNAEQTERRQSKQYSSRMEGNTIARKDIP